MKPVQYTLDGLPHGADCLCADCNPTSYMVPELAVNYIKDRTFDIDATELSFDGKVWNVRCEAVERHPEPGCEPKTLRMTVTVDQWYRSFEYLHRHDWGEGDV